MDSLSQAVLAGNRLALARLLTQVENGSPQGRQALNDLFPFTGRAHLIGVTGAPGTGKSSLVNALAHYYRHPPAGKEPQRVGILAVDPSSPFTGGAILGDRVRMRDLSGDPGVFIRSMASRGALGGLATATASLAQVLDAAGFEIILIETVGAGQAEVDIARHAHTTMVIDAPGLGDEIQSIKAGILEIADILVVNKADRPGVDATERALQSMLQLAHPARHEFRHHGRLETVETSTPTSQSELWLPPVLRTVATEGTGISELVEAISRHQQYLARSGERLQRDQSRLQTEMELLLHGSLIARWRQSIEDEAYNKVVNELVERRLSPHQAVQMLLNGDSL